MIVKVYSNEITIYNDLIRFIDIKNKFQNRALEVVLDLYKTDISRNSYQNVAKHVQELVVGDIQTIIAKLSEYGVYDKTVFDFVPKGYFESIAENSHSRTVSRTSQSSENYQQTLDIARARADSSVTGLSFGIVTNSIIGLGTHALQEHAVIKRQQERADRNYRQTQSFLESAHEREMKSIRDQGDSQYVAETAKAICELYDRLPAIYLTEVAAQGQFDMTCLDNLSFERSTDILLNLGTTSNAKTIIMSAIKLCPFNPQIYAKAILTNNYDEGMGEIIRAFQIDLQVWHLVDEENGIDKEKSGDINIILEKYRTIICAVASMCQIAVTEIESHYRKIIEEQIQAENERLASLRKNEEEHTIREEQRKKENEYNRTRERITGTAAVWLSIFLSSPKSLCKRE